MGLTHERKYETKQLFYYFLKIFFFTSLKQFASFQNEFQFRFLSLGELKSLI